MVTPPPVKAWLPAQTWLAGVVPPADEQRPRWAWLGVHGGAGVSTLARLIPGGLDTGRVWPDPRRGGPHGVLLVCRSTITGYQAASAALRYWHTGQAPGHATVWGVVVMADAPGRVPKPLGAWKKRLEGTVQHVFTVPFVPAWRIGEPTTANAPAAIRRIGMELRSHPWIQQEGR